MLWHQVHIRYHLVPGDNVTLPKNDYYRVLEGILGLLHMMAKKPCSSGSRRSNGSLHVYSRLFEGRADVRNKRRLHLQSIIIRTVVGIKDMLVFEQ